MATKKTTVKKTTAKKTTAPLSRDQQIANIKKQAQSIQSSLNKSVASGTIKSGSSSKPATTKPATTTSVSSGNPVDTNLYLKQGETPDQYKARTQAYFDSKNAPVPQTTDALKNLSVGMANGSITNQSQVTPTQTPEDWTKSIMDSMSQNNPDTSGVGTQSTQGDATAGMQPDVNGAVAGVVGQQAPGGGSVGGSADVSVPGQVSQEGTLMTGGTPMATVATGGYQKIGPAYFQKTSDGMRAVSDPTIISGLKHGTIPFSTGQLDGTTFSKHSVPLTPQVGQQPGDTTDEGATPLMTYESMKQKYGLQQGQTDFFSDPMKTISDITAQIYNASGMSDANSAIKDITGELEDLENKRDDEIADINDNPWLTEGVRLRQIASVEGRYEDKIANRTNKLRLLEDVRNNAQQQSQFAIGTAISLWDKQRTFQQAQIDSWNEQAQNEFNNKIKLTELSMKGSGNSTIDEYMFAVENGFQGDIIDYKASVASATRAPSSGGGAGGLTPAQINSTINSIAGAFDNEPIVKSYNTVQEGFQTIKSIGINTQSPADDIAFIYAFAKIMDPNSVVREGEYNTIQKYAQTWADNFGFSAKRIFSNSNFLTPQAKQNMLNTLQPKVTTITNQYQNLSNQYNRRIEEARAGGFQSITDYSLGNQSTESPFQNAFQSIQQQPGLKSVVPEYQTSSGLGYTIL